MQYDPEKLSLAILKEIHDSAVDSIIIINRKGIIQSVNPATTKMFGYLQDEVIGRNVSMLMPDPFQHEHDQYIARFLATRQAKIIGIGREVIATRKDGGQFPIHLAVSEIVQDKQTFFVGYIRDLSQYKAAEQAMQSQMLMNERLAAIGQTVSGLTHESRNALQRSHACLAELELDLAGMPNCLTLVRKVQRALDDLHQLLEEVRNYAAPIILERRQYSLPQLVREAWQSLLDVKGQGHAPHLDIHIQSDFPQTCLIDPHRFMQVIRNLLDNAWFACREPKAIEVHLKFLRPTHGVTGEVCRLEVIDNGPGVPQAEAERIFSPFYTTKTKGTGLGLALIRRYVEAHGGQVFVDTASFETNQNPAVSCAGAKFVVEFPRNIQGQPSENAQRLP